MPLPKTVRTVSRPCAFNAISCIQVLFPPAARTASVHSYPSRLSPQPTAVAPPKSAGKVPKSRPESKSLFYKSKLADLFVQTEQAADYPSVKSVGFGRPVPRMRRRAPRGRHRERASTEGLRRPPAGARRILHVQRR